jgi:hypothetical protein
MLFIWLRVMNGVCFLLRCENLTTSYHLAYFKIRVFISKTAGRSLPSLSLMLVFGLSLSLEDVFGAALSLEECLSCLLEFEMQLILIFREVSILTDETQCYGSGMTKLAGASTGQHCNFCRHG